MPRDVNGNYTLPAGNPVVTNTVISSTWANTTLSDLATAMTNSLDRTGTAAGMTGQFKAANGAIGAPGIAFGSELTMGFYRAGAGDMRFALGGVDILKFSSTVLTTPLIQAGAGAVGGPSYSWAAETNSGWYRQGAGNFRFSIAGADVVTFTTALVTVPSLSSANIIVTGATVPANGIYLSAANTLAFSSNTTLRGSVNSTGNWSFATPGSGIGATFNILSAGQGVKVTDGTVNIGIFVSGSTGQFGTVSNHPCGLFANNGNVALQVSSGGIPQCVDYGGTMRDLGFRNAPQNTQNGNYTLVLADSGKAVQANGAITVTYTVPANSSVAYDTGTIILLVNNTSNNMTVAITTDSLFLGGLQREVREFLVRLPPMASAASTNITPLAGLSAVLG